MIYGAGHSEKNGGEVTVKRRRNSLALRLRTAIASTFEPTDLSRQSLPQNTMLTASALCAMSVPAIMQGWLLEKALGPGATSPATLCVMHTAHAHCIACIYKTLPAEVNNTILRERFTWGQSFHVKLLQVLFIQYYGKVLCE